MGRFSKDSAPLSKQRYGRELMEYEGPAVVRQSAPLVWLATAPFATGGCREAFRCRLDEVGGAMECAANGQLPASVVAHCKEHVTFFKGFRHPTLHYGTLATLATAAQTKHRWNCLRCPKAHFFSFFI
jgi:hypothetical protein